MFKHLVIGCAAVLTSAAIVQAAPADDVQAAAKKLTESGYSWKTSSENAGGGGGGGGGGRGGQTGKIDKDGVAMMTLTMRDSEVQAVVGKDGKGAAKVGDDGWKSAAELDEAASGDQPNPGRFAARAIRSFKAPAAQAAAMAAKTTELKKTDDGFAGDLTEEGVKELMAFGGRRGGGGGGNTPPEVKNGKGTVAYTVKDGVLTRVKYNVQGTVTFNDQDREINRTTTVEITDVGTTKVDVPAEAKTKAGL